MTFDCDHENEWFCVVGDNIHPKKHLDEMEPSELADLKAAVEDTLEHVSQEDS